MKTSKFVICVAFVAGTLLQNCSPSLRSGNHAVFAGYASQLLDSTLKYYGIPEKCLFNENYPKQENEMVTYLVGADTVCEDKVAYLWPTSGLFSAVNALLKSTQDEKYSQLLKNVILPGLTQYYDTIRPPFCYQSYLSAAGYSDRFYDDNIWLGIDCLESYQLTGHPEYLDSSVQIWKFLESGCDSVLGGGIYWCEQQKFSKNTCSNAPASVLALKLYQVTGDKSYLQAGEKLYRWTQEHLQDTVDCLYFDHQKLDGTLSKTKYAYNSGQMLQAASLLYNITRHRQYLIDAQNLAKACSRYFFQEMKVNDGTSFRALKNGNVWFVAVMLRGFEELYRIDQNAQYLNDFKQTLDYLWKHNPNENGLFEDEQFVSTVKKKNYKWLLTQAGLIEMYARLSVFK